MTTKTMNERPRRRRATSMTTPTLPPHRSVHSPRATTSNHDAKSVNIVGPPRVPTAASGASVVSCHPFSVIVATAAITLAATGPKRAIPPRPRNPARRSAVPGPGTLLTVLARRPPISRLGACQALALALSKLSWKHGGHGGNKLSNADKNHPRRHPHHATNH